MESASTYLTYFSVYTNAGIIEPNQIIR